MRKNIFISSTYSDLKEHRQKIWESLSNYDVTIRGMEKFGARKEAPIDTCIAEVEQSDIFIIVISLRLGSIEKTTGKSYTQIEYEKAVELGKDIWVYIIDEEGTVQKKNIDSGEKYEKLKAFISILKEKHTIDSFKNENDLQQKITNKFEQILDSKKNGDKEKTPEILQKFLLTPKLYSGYEIELKIKFLGEPFPASKEICNNFYLEYGMSLGREIEFIFPKVQDGYFDYIFADEKQIDDFLNFKKNKEYKIVASINFTEKNITHIKANFKSYTYSYIPNIYDLMATQPGIKEEYVEREGRMILKFRKTIK